MSNEIEKDCKCDKKFFVDIFENTSIEITTKYFYLAIVHMIPSLSKPTEIDVNMLCKMLGLSKGQLYRCRGHLIKLGIIKLTKKFCPDTGRRTSDIYELIE